jgi:nucleotide-binding universal stress UspA family protein
MKVIVTEIAIYGEIIHYVENENMDLMVIGTRARLGFKKFIHRQLGY